MNGDAVPAPILTSIARAENGEYRPHAAAWSSSIAPVLPPVPRSHCYRTGCSGTEMCPCPCFICMTRGW